MGPGFTSWKTEQEGAHGNKVVTIVGKNNRVGKERNGSERGREVKGEAEKAKRGRE